MSTPQSLSVDEALDLRWAELLAHTYPEDPDDWFDGGRYGLLRAASATSLRRLFPMTSHNNVGFSRCSGYPGTEDCPWIWFVPGRFVTYAMDTSWRRRRLVVCDTDSCELAVAAAEWALPPSAAITWVGTADNPPDPA